jgi:hypothetical protein
LQVQNNEVERTTRRGRALMGLGEAFEASDRGESSHVTGVLTSLRTQVR